MNPSVRAVLADGQPAYVVGLSGGRGRRETMIIDQQDWEWVSENVTPAWVVNWNGFGQSYVCSGSQAAGRAAGIYKTHPRVNLHALLYARDHEVPDGQAVVFVNGDRRDLRRCNLATIARRDLGKHTGTGARATVEYLENAEDGEDP
jgi:hypothetical protein